MKLTALAVIILALGIAFGLALHGQLDGSAVAAPPCPPKCTPTPTPTPTPPPQQREDQIVFFADISSEASRPCGLTYSPVRPDCGPESLGKVYSIGFDPSKYPTDTSLTLELTGAATHNFQEICSRLYDNTAGHEVPGSEICEGPEPNGDAKWFRVRSGTLSPEPGEHEYVIQSKGEFSSGRLYAARIIVEWTE